MIGQKILHYQIDSELGRGGMGVIFAATDLKLCREVAIKFLSKELVAEGDQRARVLREARIAASLNDPRICTIHAVEESGAHVLS